MKTTGRKAFFIALVILVLPALFFFILRNGHNKYKELPHFGIPKGLKPNGDTIFHSVPPFLFTDQFGRPYGFDSLKGKIYVADFFFTSCPNICPVMTRNLKGIMQEYKDVPDFRIVSFTLDPKRDSAETLQKYAEKYKIEGYKWHFLTGPKDSIYRLMNQDGYLIVKPIPGASPNQLQHSEVMVLVDKDGYIRGNYNGTSDEDMIRLKDEIRVLLLSYSKK